MLAANTGKTDNLIEPRPPNDNRAARIWNAACQKAEDERLTGAAVLLRSAGRVVLTGAGWGLDAARFGAIALQEVGFDARAAHAADIAAGDVPLQAGDILVGIDTGHDDTPAALSRAALLGLRTIGLTDQGLTRLNGDVLVQAGDLAGTPEDPSPLAACAVLGVLTARTEPSASLAFEVATFRNHLERLADARESAVAVARQVRERPGRLILAASGPLLWVAESIARRLQMRPDPFHVVALHLAELKSPGWKLEPTDHLITLEAGSILPSGKGTGDASGHVEPVWHIGGAQRGPQLHTRIHVESRALASFGAYVALERLLDELDAG